MAPLWLHDIAPLSSASVQQQTAVHVCYQLLCSVGHVWKMLARSALMQTCKSPCEGKGHCNQGAYKTLHKGCTRLPGPAVGHAWRAGEGCVLHCGHSLLR